MDSAQRVAALVGARLVHRRELLAAGVSSRALSRAVQRGLVRRVAPGLYGPLGAPQAPDELRADAVRGVVCHLSAALLHGLELVTDPQVHHVAVGRSAHRRPLPGWRWHRADVPAHDVETRGDVRLTSVVRTLVDLLRDLPPQQSVPVVDSALRLRRVRHAEVAAAVDSLPPARGRTRARTALALADVRSESVLESVTRVALLEGGVAPEAVQLPIRDATGLVGRVDFAWPSARVVLEVDGFAFHASRGEFRADRRRRNRLVLAGWVVLNATWEDAASGPERLVAMVRGATTAGAQAAASSRSL